jgi:hypothetical protein
VGSTFPINDALGDVSTGATCVVVDDNIDGGDVLHFNDSTGSGDGAGPSFVVAEAENTGGTTLPITIDAEVVCVGGACIVFDDDIDIGYALPISDATGSGGGVCVVANCFVVVNDSIDGGTIFPMSDSTGNVCVGATSVVVGGNFEGGATFLMNDASVAGVATRPELCDTFGGYCCTCPINDAIGARVDDDADAGVMFVAVTFGITLASSNNVAAGRGIGFVVVVEAVVPLERLLNEDKLVITFRVEVVPVVEEDGARFRMT